MPPVRVLITTLFGRRLGGSEQVLWELLQRGDRTVVDPYVVFHEDGPFVDDVRALGIGTEVIDPGRFREVWAMTRAVGRLSRTMRRERPDLVVHWLNRAQVYGAPAAVLAGLGRRTMWFQRHLPDGSDPLDRVATRLPALAVGTPSAGAAQAQARLLRPARPTFWVHNGIEPPPRPSDAMLAGLREQHGLPSGVPLVGIVGRLQRWKGQDRFLDALADLRGRGVPVHGVVVGGSQHGVDEDFPAELEAQRARLGLADHVTFIGQVADAAPWFALLDVTVSASTEESFGLVLLEAMGQGSPVVAVDHGGPAEILDHGRTGVLVASGAPADLAAGVAGLLADEDRRRAIADAARAEVRERFSIDRMVGDLQTCLAELAQGRVPEPPAIARR